MALLSVRSNRNAQYKRCACAALLILLGQGCAHKALPEGFRFTTHITPERHKLFQLAFPAPERRVSLYNNRTPQNEGKPRFSDRQLTALLERALQRFPFCRDGYLLLGRYAGETTERIRGECTEQASDEDITQFPNTLKQW